MIKYASVQGFTPVGEIPVMGSHLYQWVNTSDVHHPVLLIRAYDVKAKMWYGLLYVNDLEYKNLPGDEIDLEDIKLMLGSDLEIVEDFKDFIKGNMMEEYFKPFIKLE